MSSSVPRKRQQQRSNDKTAETAGPTVAETLSKAFTAEATWEDKVRKFFVHSCHYIFVSSSSCCMNY